MEILNNRFLVVPEFEPSAENSELALLASKPQNNKVARKNVELVKIA